MAHTYTPEQVAKLYPDNGTDKARSSGPHNRAQLQQRRTAAAPVAARPKLDDVTQARASHAFRILRSNQFTQEEKSAASATLKALHVSEETGMRNRDLRENTRAATLRDLQRQYSSGAG